MNIVKTSLRLSDKDITKFPHVLNMTDSLIDSNILYM